MAFSPRIEQPYQVQRGEALTRLMVPTTSIVTQNIFFSTLISEKLGIWGIRKGDKQKFLVIEVHKLQLQTHNIWKGLKERIEEIMRFPRQELLNLESLQTTLESDHFS